jgi:hypothetical protein
MKDFEMRLGAFQRTDTSQILKPVRYVENE